jgi:hypothetical protein
MKTRVGKIAQLPKPIRDELNHRLENGKQGPELLRWLNALPETKELLAEKFEGSPINRQNLTEWRHGGYEEWLRHQEREHRIQRITEEGGALKQRENIRDNDIFENSARIALAELMADLDSLYQLKGEERWNRLRSLTHELTRLQSAYNRSRWAELAWTKWNDRFLGPNDYDRGETTTPENPTLDKISNPPNSPEVTKSLPLPKGEGRGEGKQDVSQSRISPPAHIEPEPTTAPVAQVSKPAVSPTSSRQPAAIAERPEPPLPISNLQSQICNLPNSNLDTERKPNQTTSTREADKNGAPAPVLLSLGEGGCSRLATPENPRATSNTPVRTNPLRPLSLSSPSSPTSTDFSRRMALLKASGQFP